MTSSLTLEQVKVLIGNLTVEEQLCLLEDLEERLETTMIMKLAETGFQEWNDPEEDIYHVEP